MPTRLDVPTDSVRAAETETMHERRNFALVLVLAGAVVWAVLAWLFLGPEVPARSIQRFAAIVTAAVAGGWLLYALRIEDRLPDYLQSKVGQMYYEVDGLCFMPIVQQRRGRTELAVYYQNRFENPVQAVVHLRPREAAFQIQPGWHDVHFAFTCAGGDFGVIHQPIRVEPRYRGEVIEVELGALSFYPRSHGARWRHRQGMPCGEVLVDWGGAAFKTGVHEVSGEIELRSPTLMHLAMPPTIKTPKPDADFTWRQECLHAGVAT